MRMSGDCLAAFRSLGARLHSHLLPPLRAKSRMEVETTMCKMAGRSGGADEATDLEST